MLVTAKRILKKDISPNKLDRNFPDPGTPEKDETVDKINNFLALVLPDINAGRKPDTRWAAEQTGILPEDAEQIVSDVLKKKDGL